MYIDGEWVDSDASYAGGFPVGLAVVHFQHFAHVAGTYEFGEPQPQSEVPTLAANTIVKEAIGVCAGIIPWNFPLLLAVWRLGPGLAAGNSMVLKPDEKTLLTLLEFGASPRSAACSRGAERGDRRWGRGRRPTRLPPDVDKTAFTGSTAVGREVVALAAPTVKRVTLELGGRGPVIVLDDAAIETAVDAALFGCWLFSGQARESGTRMLRPRALHDSSWRR